MTDGGEVVVPVTLRQSPLDLTSLASEEVLVPIQVNISVEQAA